MVGNDIVDIDLTKRTTRWKRPGFIQKVFTSEEQACIEKSKHPFTTVWRLWSMKESAYKVYVQAGSARFFNPTQLRCRLSDSSNVADLKKGSVRIGSMNLEITTSVHAGYIFSTASTAKFKIHSAVLYLEGTTIQEQSSFMHQQLLEAVAKKNDLHRNCLSLTKNSKGVPTLIYQKKPLKHSISITHHGRYGAYSIAMG